MNTKIPPQKIINYRKTLKLPSWSGMTVRELVNQLMDLPLDAVIEQDARYYEGDPIEYSVHWSEEESDEAYQERIKLYQNQKLESLS